VVGHKLHPEDLRRARHTGQNLSPLTTLWDKHSPGQARVRTRAHEHKHTPQDKHTRAARTGPRCRSSSMAFSRASRRSHSSTRGSHAAAASVRTSGVMESAVTLPTCLSGCSSRSCPVAASQSSTVLSSDLAEARGALARGGDTEEEGGGGV